MTLEFDNEISMLDFMQENSTVLHKKVTDRLAPIYNPEAESEQEQGWRSFLENSLLRSLYPKQTEAVIALTKGHLEGNTGQFLVAEMGAGKSIMFLAIVHLLGHILCKNRYRILIVCPAHLVQKWENEIILTIPNARVSQITSSLPDIIELSKAGLPRGPQFHIASKDSIKLGYSRQYGGYFSKSRNDWVCPDCGEPVKYKSAKTSKPRCVSCKSQLWQPKLAEISHCPHCKAKFGNKKGHARITVGTDSFRKCSLCKGNLLMKKPQRYSVAKYMKQRFPKDFFTITGFDESQKFKAGDSAQGLTMGQIAKISRFSTSLTGTIMGGYVRDLFYQIYRTNSRRMAEICPYGQQKDFSEMFGVVRRIEKTRVADSAGTFSDAKKSSTRTVEDPGISPQLIPLLLEFCYFMRLRDVRPDMPPYEEHLIEVPMLPDQEKVTEDFENDVMDLVRLSLARGDKSLLHAIITSLLPHADRCRKPVEFRHPREINPFDFDWNCPECKCNFKHDAVTATGNHRLCPKCSTGLKAGPARKTLLAKAPGVKADILPKEEWTIEHVGEAKKAGKKVLIFVEDVGVHDLIPDLADRLEKSGAKVLVLRSDSAAPKNREAWVRSKMKVLNPDVMICNPQLVETGLDLIEFTDIIVFQMTYNVITLLQATHRSWRIIQNSPVDVYYLAYEGTLQIDQRNLVAEKVAISEGVAGKCDSGALAESSETGANGIIALAKVVAGELKTRKSDSVFGNRGIHKPAEPEFMPPAVQPVFHYPCLSLDMVMIASLMQTAETETIRHKDGSRICFRLKRGEIIRNNDHSEVRLFNGNILVLTRETDQDTGRILYNDKEIGNYSKKGFGVIRNGRKRWVKLDRNSAGSGYAMFELMPFAAAPDHISV